MPSALASLTKGGAALGLLVLALGLVAVGRWWGRATTPQPNTAPPDTVTRTRELVKRDTVTQTVPETVIRYDTVRATDTVRIAVPDSARIKGIIEPSPLDLTEGEATLTYYDPAAGRYMQDVYDIPADRNRLAAFARTYGVPGVIGTTLGARYERRLSWGRLSVAPGDAVTSKGHGPAVTVSLSTGLSW